MSKETHSTDIFKGHFSVPLPIFRQKLLGIKAFLLDWDGVFNDGRKASGIGSGFSEVDSMAINMMRFGYYLSTGKMAHVAIITGEDNPSAKEWAEREHIHAIYFKAANKLQALDIFLEKHKLKAEECSFTFDDILDLSVADKVGLRFMIGRNQNPLLNNFAERNKLYDYRTKNDGSQYALREIGELYLHQLGNFDAVIQARMKFAGAYREYLRMRQAIQTQIIDIRV